MHQIKEEVIEDPEVESKYIDCINTEEADLKPVTLVVENQLLQNVMCLIKEETGECRPEEPVMGSGLNDRKPENLSFLELAEVSKHGHQCVMCRSENEIEEFHQSDFKHSDVDVKHENEPLSELVPVLKNEDQVSLYEAESQSDSIGKWIDDSTCLTKETKLENDLSIQLNPASSSENRNVIFEMEKTLPLCNKCCLSCTICIKNFNSQKDLMDHMLLHNSASVNSEIFFCDICGLSFTTKKNVSRHLISHKSNKSEQFSCDLCSKSFSQKIYLERHIRSHTGERPYSCNLCSKSFSHSGHLNRHMHIHTGIRAFMCNICTKSFSQSSSLKNHIQIHTGIRAFMCIICTKSFSQSSSLRRHMHNHTNSCQFSCNVCGKSYSGKHERDRHVMCIHTGDGFFYCNFCNKKFMDKRNLRFHIHNHTGERPFSCNFCSKSFVRKYDLKIHGRVHTNEHPFTCKLCSKTFNHRCNLNSHMRKHQ